MIRLADMGLAQRVFEDYRRADEADAFHKLQRALAHEQQGWQREDRPVAQQEQRRASR